jgi:glycosyltransferase involved in cell wall biosynthesis
MGPVIDATVVHPPFTGVHYAVRQETLALLATGTDHGPWSCLARDPDLVQEALALKATVPLLGSVLDHPLGRIAWQQLRLAGKLREWGASALLGLAGTAPPRCPVPLYLQIHDTIALRRPDLCRAINACHMRLLLPPAARQAHTIIVSAAAVADELHQLLGIPFQRLQVVPLGLDEVFVQVAQAETPPVAPPPVRDLGPYLLFVGGPEPRKGLGTLLAALAPSFPWPLVQVGAALPASAGASVIPLGYVAREWLPGLYAHAAATIVPSLEEGFSLPVLEALACGCPVIHRDHPVLRQTAGGHGEAFKSGSDEVRNLRGLLTVLRAAGAPDPARRWEARSTSRIWAASHTPAHWASAVASLLP